MGGLLLVPCLQAEVQTRALQEARAAGVVDLYHGCHRLLWNGEVGLNVRNFTGLLVEATRLPDHEVRVQRYREMPGIQQVVEVAQDLMRANGIEQADVERTFPGLFQRLTSLDQLKDTSRRRR